VAVQVLTILAYKQGEQVTSTLLAASVNTNPVVIRRLLRVLQHAGFVETRKGASVGSRLCQEPRRIDLAQIYRAVETTEPFRLPVKRGNHDCAMGTCIQSALIQIFAATEIAMERELAKTNLGHILALMDKTCGQNRKRST
jgi:DNA-binding IscR family transcriptional regulator